MNGMNGMNGMRGIKGIIGFTCMSFNLLTPRSIDISAMWMQLIEWMEWGVWLVWVVSLYEWFVASM